MAYLQTAVLISPDYFGAHYNLEKTSQGPQSGLQRPFASRQTMPAPTQT
jgi:hypothetical protein